MRRNWRKSRHLASLVPLAFLALALGTEHKRLLLQPLFAWPQRVADH